MNYAKNLIKDHLNINFVRNEFSAFTDIFLISETKIDEPFLNSQFFDDGNKMFRKDCNVNGGGLILYGKENTSSKLVKTYRFSEEIEIIALEFSISGKMWLP